MSSSSFAFIFAQATTNAAAAATGTDATTPQGPPGWTNLVFFALLLAMVYFALIRPQMQAKKKQEETIKGARTGDKIVTTGGILGTVTNVKEKTVVVRIADNVKVEMLRSAIQTVTQRSGDDEQPASKN